MLDCSGAASLLGDWALVLLVSIMTMTSVIEKSGTCPVNHSAFSKKRTKSIVGETRWGEKLGRDPQTNIWHIYDYDLARKILRNNEAKQAGFQADVVEMAMDKLNLQTPILYMRGKDHALQRRATARYFTPKQVDSEYRKLMNDVADSLMEQVKREASVELSELSLDMAVRVASQIVGLTNSRRAGLAHRFEGFFEQEPDIELSWRNPRAIWDFALNQVRTLNFFYTDVKPAIAARQKERQEDVISHLLDMGYSDKDIMIETITYGAAGMVTTREFITAAAWHLLTNEALRETYVNAEPKEREQILEEILRIEPVVQTLKRVLPELITVDDVTIDAGETVFIHLDIVNQDKTVVGENEDAVCPMRDIEKSPYASVVAFGDGPHRCPGAYVAIQESDVFLHKLMRLDGLRLVSEPHVEYGGIHEGYHISNFKISTQ